MKTIIPLFFFCLSFFQSALCCSMYKITHEGKTIVGNNEDWFSPNSQIWFLPKGDKKYGVMHVGFINGFPQGGINEAGLMFDGFAMSYLPVNNTQGKLKIPVDEAITHAMQTFANVQDVKDYLSTIDLSELATGMFVFVDRTGSYLIAEGDELIIGNESEQIFSNFYPSQSKNSNIPFYRAGLNFIQQSEGSSSFNYCASVMNAMKQDITQYSTVYDLEKQTVRVYYFQDLDNFQEINLAKELEKGKRIVSIPEMFPANVQGKEYHSVYNDSERPTVFLEDMFKNNYSHLTGTALIRAKENFAQYLNIIGYEWLNDKKDVNGAIAIFTYGTELIPNHANLFDSLGEAYFNANNYPAALENYEKSIKLNPDNALGIEMISKIKELLKQ